MFGIDDELSVGLLGSKKDSRNFHAVFAGIGDEDNAPAPYPLAVMTLPFHALQGLYVTPKWVFRHFLQAFEDKILIIPRGHAKLSCGGS